MKNQLLQDLQSAKNQLIYCNNALNTKLENWEKKEFEQVKVEVLSNIESLEFRINLL